MGGLRGEGSDAGGWASRREAGQVDEPVRPHNTDRRARPARGGAGGSSPADTNGASAAPRLETVLPASATPHPLGVWCRRLAHLSLPVVNCRKARCCSRLSPCSTSQKERTAGWSLQQTRGACRPGCWGWQAATPQQQRRRQPRQRAAAAAHPAQQEEPQAVAAGKAQVPALVLRHPLQRLEIKVGQPADQQLQLSRGEQRQRRPVAHLGRAERGWGALSNAAECSAGCRLFQGLI